jgi:hypothetical protein
MATKYRKPCVTPLGDAERLTAGGIAGNVQEVAHTTTSTSLDL